MKPPTKLVDASPEFEAFRLEILGVLKKHTGDLPSDKMLAVAAYTVGQIMAMQDQRSMTPNMAFELVGKNIELGNEHAVKEIMGEPVGRA